MQALKTLIDKFYKIDSTFIRFVFVGCLNTAFGMGVYCLCIFVGCPYYLATLISNVLGMLFNFKTTGTLVFKNNNNKLIIRFVMCYLLVYVINTLFVKSFILLGINDYYSGIIATPITALCSYILLKKLVYNEKN